MAADLREHLLRSNDIPTHNVGGVLNMFQYNRVSGPRSQLSSGFYQQMVELDNPEVPLVFTGFEKELGSYNDSLRLAGTDYKILHRIEKYPQRPGTFYILIVQDIHTGTIGIFENSRFTSLAEEHGYTKPMVPVDSRGPGMNIQRGEVIHKSNSHDEHMNYRYGVNAKTAYISHMENIEDGISISESFAKRVSYMTVNTVELVLGFNDILLNFYGDDDNYKSFPDIFEKVKEGIVCAKRGIDIGKLSSDTTVEALKNLQTTDEVFHGKGNGEVLDIEVYINSNSEAAKDNAHRNQILKYHEICKEYKQTVAECLGKYVTNRKKYKVTSEANSLYSRYRDEVDAYKDHDDSSRLKFVNGAGKLFEFALVKITIGKHVNLAEGSKLTNRFGGKGVVTAVIPDHLMPIDEYGNRVEVCINPNGVVGRSNPGQNVEHELNFCAQRLCQLVSETSGLPNKYKLIQKFLSMCDENYGNHFAERYSKLNTFNRNAAIQDIVDNKLYIYQHSFRNITYNQLKAIYMHFGFKPSKVKTSLVDPHTGELKTYQSMHPVFIADQYVMLLKHTTDDKKSSTSISEVNSLGLPHKSNSKSKGSEPMRGTPIRFSQMELDISCCRVKPAKVHRFMAGNGCNLKHRDAVKEMLLHEDPFRYNEVDIGDDEIINNIASDSFVATMHQMGYTIFSNTVTTDVEYGGYAEGQSIKSITV